MGRRFGAAAAAALCLVLAVPATAQQQKAASARPGWLPRRIDMGGGLTAAQRATAVARLEQIERILLQVPELARPHGFEIMPHFDDGARQPGPHGVKQPGHVVEYMLRLFFFAPSKAEAGAGCSCITITVNHSGGVGGSGFQDAQGRTIFVEAPRGTPLPLATHVYNGLSEKRERSSVTVFLTAGGASPWKTVTRQAFYDAMIFDTEDKDGATLADFRESLNRTPYQDWMDRAVERKQQREQTLRTAARYQTAAEVEMMRRRIEATERQVTENLQASEARDREANRKALALSYARTGTMRAELDAMTPAERSMPALIDLTLTEAPMATGWRLTSVDSPKAWRVLTPDYDFLRARRSPVEVRSIMVSITANGTGLKPAVHNALLQTFKRIDWAALNKLLDAPR